MKYFFGTEIYVYCVLKNAELLQTIQNFLIYLIAYRFEEVKQTNINSTFILWLVLPLI